VGLAHVDQRRDDAAADVVVGVLVFGVEADDVDQCLRGEDVVPHRGEDLLGRVGQARRLRRFLLERPDPGAITDLDHAQLVGLRARPADPGHGHPGAGGDVLLDHLSGVHPINVVGSEHEDVLRRLVDHQVEVLVDGVGRAGEPPGPPPHLGRHRGDVAAEQGRQPPRPGDVEVEAVALVLGQDHDPQIAGVGHVRQGEVDDAVVPAEGHRRLRPVGGERRQALPLAAGEDHGQDVGFGHFGGYRTQRAHRTG
jgi:hypothetical protein